MEIQIYQRLKALRLMQEIQNDFIKHEISMGDLKEPFQNEYKNLKEELIYFLVVENGKREFAKDNEIPNDFDPLEINYTGNEKYIKDSENDEIEFIEIDMEKFKNNKHEENTLTEEQLKHYYTKS
ncbi:MAG TPA: hypothetical protein PL131_09515 [Methylotenera sp.]|nr:hypothetical protein [Methylotenera sp.]HPH06100.1 hypothetical protein [Methylotenera sp.]